MSAKNIKMICQLDDVMLMTNKMVWKSFMCYFLQSYRKKILVSFYLYINENYFKDILTGIEFNWKLNS